MAPDKSRSEVSAPTNDPQDTASSDLSELPELSVVAPHPSEDSRADEPSETSSHALKPSSQTETRVAVEPPETSEEQPNDVEVEATRAGPPITLDVLEGPDAGKNIRFNRVRMVLGRQEGAELRLTDLSVSRRHAELVQGEKGVLCRDLGSGNGTKVNGSSITEQLLSSGDKISIGKTVILFVDESEALKKLREEARAQGVSHDEGQSLAQGNSSEASPEESFQEQSASSGLGQKWQSLPPLNQVQKAVLGALVLALFLMLVLFWMLRGPKTPTPEQVATEKLESARVAFKAGRLEDSIRYAKEAERIFPDIDSESLLEVAKREFAAATALKSARALMEEQKFEQAREALKVFPEGSGSVLSAERETLLEELAKQEVIFWRAEAERHLRAGQLDLGRSFYQRLPPEKKEELKALLDTVEEEVLALERRQAAKAAALRALRQRQREANREAEMDAAFVSVSRKFHAGDYKRAASECDRVADEFRSDSEIRARAKQLQVMIPNFGRFFEDGTRKFKLSQWSTAIPALRKARELYLKIGFPGAIGQQIDEQLAAALFAKARDAINREEYAQAASGFKEAFRYAGDDPRFRDGIERLERKAAELYHQGYLMKESDPSRAKSLLKSVLQMSSPGSELYEKAKRQMAELNSRP